VLALAWRNLWRQRRRSLTTLGAVALVVAFSITYYGMGGAITNSMYRHLTEGIGQVQVHVDGYRDIRDLSRSLIRDASAVRPVIEQRAQGGEVVGVLDVPGLLIHGERSRAVAVRGSDWPPLIRTRYLLTNTLEGSFVQAGDTGHIVLGRALARALSVGIGDEVAFYAPGTEGFGAASLTVGGLLDTQDPALAGRTALISLATAQLIAAPDAVSRFEIHLPDIHRLEDDVLSVRVADALRPELPQLSVETWQQLFPELLQLLHAFGPMMAVVTLIFFVLAALLVVNTVYLGLIERIREFGVLMSLGVSGRRVMGLITLESVLLCLTGAVLGTGVGLAAVGLMARGFTVPGLEHYYASFGMDPTMYASIGPGQVLLAVGLALASGVLAALWPASLAAKLEPVEAMRFTA